jgi:hypothetical protein
LNSGEWLDCLVVDLNTHQRYTALRGILVSRYSGEVRLTEVKGGHRASVDWHVRAPHTRIGRLLATVVGLAIAKIADRAINIAEQAADTAA